MCSFWPLNLRCSFFKCRNLFQKDDFFPEVLRMPHEWLRRSIGEFSVIQMKRVLNEWFVCVFLFAFLCLCLIWHWFSKDVRFFFRSKNEYLHVLTTWQVLKTAAIFKVFGRWMYAFGTSSHRLQSPSMILFVLPHKPSSCPKMLNLKIRNHVFFRENLDMQLPHPFFDGRTCFQLVSWQFQLSLDVGWKTSRSFNTTGSAVSVHLRHEGSPTFPSRHRFPTVSNKKKVAQCTNCEWWAGTCCAKLKGKGGGNWVGYSHNSHLLVSGFWGFQQWSCLQLNLRTDS